MVQPTPADSRIEAAAHACGLIEKVLSERLAPTHPRWKAELVSERPSHGGTRVFRATAEHGAHVVAAKLYSSAFNLTAEYQAAEVAWARGASIPKPLLCDVDRKLLVSAWVDGETLTDRIKAGQWEQGAQIAGQWLRRFHQPSRRRPALYRPLFSLVRVSHVSAALPRYMTYDERQAFRQAVGAVVDRAAMDWSGFEGVVHLHGDPNPSNLILSAAGPMAVDLHDARPGLKYQDIAAATVHLAIMTAFGPTPGAFDCRLARQALLSAYGLRSRREEARLALAEGVELLRRWQMLSLNGGMIRSDGGVVRTAIFRDLFARFGWNLVP